MIFNNIDNITILIHFQTNSISFVFVFYLFPSKFSMYHFAIHVRFFRYFYQNKHAVNGGRFWITITLFRDLSVSRSSLQSRLFSRTTTHSPTSWVRSKIVTNESQLAFHFNDCAVKPLFVDLFSYYQVVDPRRCGPRRSPHDLPHWVPQPTQTFKVKCKNTKISMHYLIL